MRRALYCVPMAFKGLHYATARVARRLLPRLRGSEDGGRAQAGDDGDKKLRDFLSQTAHMQNVWTVEMHSASTARALPAHRALFHAPPHRQYAYLPCHPPNDSKAWWDQRNKLISLQLGKGCGVEGSDTWGGWGLAANWGVVPMHGAGWNAVETSGDSCRSTSEIRCSRVDEGMGTRGGTPPPIRGAPVAEVAVVATISAGDGSAGLDVSPRGKPPAQSLPPLIAQFRWALICA